MLNLDCGSQLHARQRQHRFTTRCMIRFSAQPGAQPHGHVSACCMYHTHVLHATSGVQAVEMDEPGRLAWLSCGVQEECVRAGESSMLTYGVQSRAPEQQGSVAKEA